MRASEQGRTDLRMHDVMGGVGDNESNVLHLLWNCPGAISEGVS